MARLFDNEETGSLARRVEGGGRKRLELLQADQQQQQQQQQQQGNKRLVPFYPIHGKPFLSFIPDVEFADIARRRRQVQ